MPSFDSGLPHYRSFLNSPNRMHGTPIVPNLTRTRSDGNLEKKNKRSYNANATISQKTRESVKNVMTESGYRSENIVRPNMEESMKFFKKLFTQPQEEGGSAGFSTALSPPDRPRHCKFDTHVSRMGFQLSHIGFTFPQYSRTIYQRILIKGPQDEPP